MGCCSGQVPDLDQCQKGSEEMLHKATKTLLKVQEDLNNVSPLENIDRAATKGPSDPPEALLTRLDSVFNAMRELNPSVLDGPGAEYIIKAGSCFDDVSSKA